LGGVWTVGVISRKSRFEGALLGMAVGDALGGTVQNMSRAEIGLRFGVLKDIVGGGWLNLRPGEFGKSTQMALALAASILSAGRFDVASATERYLEWFGSWPKDVGLATSSSLALLAEGAGPREAPSRVHELLQMKTAGSSPLSRAGPLALLDCADPKRLVEDTLADARITHLHDLAGLTAAALNLMTTTALNGQSSREETVSVARATLAGRHVDLDSALAPPYDVATADIDATGYCVDTLRVVTYSFVNTTTFEDALIFAVNIGGNADVIGAAVGRLCGAYYGVEAIPAGWLNVLEHRDRIIEVADRLFDLASARGVGE